MSNCYLRKLSTNPGKLFPLFYKHIYEYNLVLELLDHKVMLDVITEHPNDFYKINGNPEDYGNSIHVNEGGSKIINILVYSEYRDNLRKYTIYISRTTPKVALLESILIHPGKLIPSYNSSMYHYTCTVGSNISYIKLHFEMPDSRCLLLVNKDEPKVAYDLYVGITTFKIKIYSPDETQIKKYVIDVYKKEIPRYVCINDPIRRMKLEDPISLSPLIYPMRIPEYDVWSVMSSTTLNRVRDLKLMTYGKRLYDNKPFSIEYDIECENRISESKGIIPLTYGGFSNESKLSNIGGLLLKCNEPSPFRFFKLNKVSVFLELFDLNPDWQANLERIDTDEDDTLVFSLEEAMTEYFFYLPTARVTDNFQFLDDENPMEKLKEMMSMVAKGLGKDLNNSDLHLTLALLLEEKFMIEDTLNIKSNLFNKSDSRNQSLSDIPNQWKINEICMRQGFTKTPTLSQQLRALLEEHATLLAKSYLKEADLIQNIYEWKSREASQEGKISILVSEYNNNLGQAAIKYFTALKLDLNSAVKNFHVARMMIFEGKYGQAIIRLEHALTLNPNHMPSRFLLGFAQANLVKLTDHKIDRTIEMLLDGMENALAELSNNSMLGEVDLRNSPKKLIADDTNFFVVENPLLCRGILALGKLLLKKGLANIYIRALHVFHIALHVATLGWSTVSQGLVMGQFEFVIMECHDELYHIIGDEIHDVPTEVILKRCEWLYAFISGCSVPTCQRTIDIQEDISRMMVFHQPCNEYYLINLGMVLMKKADMFPYKHVRFMENIKHAIYTFRTALEMNGKPMLGPAANYLQGLAWFKIHRLNYLTKKAPIVICESFRLMQNEYPVSQYDSDYALSSKNVPRSSQRKSRTSVAKISSARPSTIKPPIMIPPTTKSATAGQSLTKITNEVTQRKGLSIHQHYDIPKSACYQLKIKKNTFSNANMYKALTSKQLASDKLSLFRSCHHQKVNKSVFHNLNKENFSAAILVNPPTVYSRLLLGRAFRSNHQFLEAVKCFNYIRKLPTSIMLKSTVNREMIEILLECENYTQALDFMSKVHIAESKITSEDLMLCNEIMKLLIKLHLFDDERLEKHCSILAKHRGIDSIKDILFDNNLSNLFLKICAKLKL